MEYWIQMQIQMEVCNLNECDFLETRFIEYENETEFLNDGTFRYTKDGKRKGIIMYFINDGQPHYEYSPWNINKTNFMISNNNTEKKFVKPTLTFCPANKYVFLFF